MRALQAKGTTLSWQRNLWATVAAEILAILGFQASFILIPYYIQQMGITRAAEVATWTGAYQSVGAISFAVFTPIWGTLGDRYGRKIMLVRAMAATVLVLILMGLARTPAQLMLLRVVQGCLTGTPAAASALVATTLPKDRLAYGLGLVQTAVFVGSSLGPMMGGYIGDALSYRSTFFVSAGIVLVGFVLILFWVNEPPESHAMALHARKESPLRALRGLLGSPYLVLLIGVNLAINLTVSMLGPVLPILIQRLVAQTERLASTAGTISGVAALASAVSALVIGRLSDRLGYRATLLACAAVTTLLYFPLAFSRTPFTLGLFQALQGFFRGGIAPSTSALVVEQASPEKAGAALGLNTSAASVGFAVGPLLGAALVNATSTRNIFILSALFFGAITLAIALANGRYKTRYALLHEPPIA